MTTQQLAEDLKTSASTIRRIVDSLGEEIPRVGLYRVIPSKLVPKIKAELVRRGLCTQEPVAAH